MAQERHQHATNARHTLLNMCCPIAWVYPDGTVGTRWLAAAGACAGTTLLGQPERMVRCLP